MNENYINNSFVWRVQRCQTQRALGLVILLICTIAVLFDKIATEE